MTFSARPLLVTFGIVVAGLTIGLIAAQQPPSRSGASFTAAQADAGRSAYDASCSGCHLRDLKGSFEAPQLAGSNFVNQWGDKTTSELYTYLMASMPPTDPGGPGGPAMIAIVAYLLQSNGARAGSQPLTPQTAAAIRSVVGSASTRVQTSSRPPAGDTAPPAPARKGLTVKGEVKNFVPVTDAMLRKPDAGDWLVFRGNYHGWSYSALKEVTAQNVGDLELAWV